MVVKINKHLKNTMILITTNNRHEIWYLPEKKQDFRHIYKELQLYLASTNKKEMIAEIKWIELMPVIKWAMYFKTMLAKQLLKSKKCLLKWYKENFSQLKPATGEQLKGFDTIWKYYTYYKTGL